MSNSKAPKIVVAVALAAVYGTGLAMVGLRESQDNGAAQGTVVAPATQAVEQPAVMTEAPAPVASAAVNTPEAATREAEVVKAEPEHKETSVATGQGVAGMATGSSAETRELENRGSTGEAASVGKESDDSADDTPSSGEAESESAGDGSEVEGDVGT